ncbi:helix-turn-helix domain-containing protein [Salinibacter ruber]|uniref:helix-turn-helix domain-containing protein n=1 Tax=Salinibacter ruber TaxID=146919 RepID=UPI0020747F84|nr:helix-turn-helix transcriptional regulator [Salinibacter ruber]
MIRTDAEYKNAQEKLDQEQDTLKRQREQLEEMDLSEEETQRALEPMVSFRDGLREEMETYERMRRGDLSALHNLNSIGRWFIGARIAKGWSLSKLADKLDVSVQQVSRDEQNEYHGITAKRAQRILETLGVRFRLEVEEPVLSGEEDREKATV